jgi:hypothetical protein
MHIPLSLSGSAGLFVSSPGRARNCALGPGHSVNVDLSARAASRCPLDRPLSRAMTGRGMTCVPRRYIPILLWIIFPFCRILDPSRLTECFGPPTFRAPPFKERVEGMRAPWTRERRVNGITWSKGRGCLTFEQEATRLQTCSLPQAAQPRSGEGRGGAPHVTWSVVRDPTRHSLRSCHPLPPPPSLRSSGEGHYCWSLL